jgi:hypothetical protein
VDLDMARPHSRRPRSVAQSGSAPRSGRGGRRFKSCHSDHTSQRGSRLRGLIWGTKPKSEAEITIYRRQNGGVLDRGALESRGPETVRSRLARYGGGSASAIGGLGSETITRGFAEE